MLRTIAKTVVGILGLVSYCAAADTTVKPLQSYVSAATAGYTLLVRKENSMLARVNSGSAAEEQQVWWLVFNNPGACAERPCSLNDIYRKETLADLIPAAADERARGSNGDMCLSAGQQSGSLMPRFGMPASGLIDVAAAEVQLLVAGSGEHMETWVRRATSDSMRDCSNCNTVQVAVHVPRS